MFENDILVMECTAAHVHVGVEIFVEIFVPISYIVRNFHSEKCLCKTEVNHLKAI